MNDYLKGRALEWSTLRGVIWLSTGLLGVDLTDAQVTDLLEAAETVFNVVSDEGVQTRLWAKVAAWAMAFAGFVGMVTPDGQTDAGWKFLRSIFVWRKDNEDQNV